MLPVNRSGDESTSTSNHLCYDLLFQYYECPDEDVDCRPLEIVLGCTQRLKEFLILLHTFKTMHSFAMLPHGSMMSFFNQDLSSDNDFFFPNGHSDPQRHLHQILGQLSNSILGVEAGQSLSIVDIVMILKFPSTRLREALILDTDQSSFQKLYQEELWPRFSFGNDEFSATTRCHFGPYREYGGSTGFGTSWKEYANPNFVEPTYYGADWREFIHGNATLPCSNETKEGTAARGDCCLLFEPLFKYQNIRGILEIIKSSGGIATNNKLSSKLFNQSSSAFVRHRYNLRSQPAHQQENYFHAKYQIPDCQVGKKVKSFG